MSQGLDPAREAVPGLCWADGNPDLLYEDEEGSSPEYGAVNFVGGPEVVGDHAEQGKIRAQVCPARVPAQDGKGPTGDGLPS
jgi:hypothetical protein